MAETVENNEVEIKKSKKKSGKKKPKIWLIIVIVAIVILLIVGIANAIAGMQESMKTAMEQMAGENETVYEVKREDVEQEILTSGTVVGIEKNAYTSPVTAKVEDICVEVGQTVKKGDVLLTYDASELGDNLTKVKIQAQSERAAGNESYEMANEAASKTSDAKKKIKELKKDIKSLENKIQSLTKKITTYEDKLKAAGEAVDETTAEADEEENAAAGLTAKEEKDYKKAVSELEKKNKSLAAKQEALAEQEAIVAANQDVKVSESTKAQISATNQLSDMSINEAQESVDAAEAGITAVEDGIVESIEVVKGAYASETQTLMTIISANQIGVEFSISKDDLGSISNGQKARIVIGNKEYEGTVAFVSRVASTDSILAASDSAAGGSIKGRIVLDDPDDEIFVGVSAKAYIFVGESQKALVIPYEALCTDIDGDYVYVVNDNNIIERKDIKVGLYSEEYYEVLEGIEEGDKVITEVTKDMKPGDEYVDPVAAMTAK